MKNPNVTLDLELSGEKICTAIKESGYSVKEIQYMLYLECPNPIYRWMRGKTLPSIENLYRLSLILNMPMEDLLGVKSF